MLRDRIALVTGASRGIGRQVALGLAREGAHVIAVARTQGALEELDDEIKAAGSSATLVPLDMNDMEGIDRLGGAIFDRWKKLDILIGNAAILGSVTPISHAGPKEWNDVMTVNVTANWRLIRSMDTLLRQSDAGRAVFVTSGVTNFCPPYWGEYAISKAALEALARTYAAETVNTNVRVNLFNPGPIRTSMRAKAMPGENPMTLEPPEALVPGFIKLVSPDFTGTCGLYNHPTKEYRAYPSSAFSVQVDSPERKEIAPDQ